MPPMIAPVLTPFEAPAFAPRAFGADVSVEVASSLVLVSVELELEEIEVVVEVEEVVEVRQTAGSRVDKVTHVVERGPETVASGVCAVPHTGLGPTGWCRQ